ncbi:hypothetical protein DPMN_018196 [Dreissena polymorpha]|uniref:Uncharacterized protein n=1 Tax=Dreissena polymorpha TaxID=45954 RepID=A0A9D4NHY8_DREPO|nr:hypothetical protein DPMN_018196 [Dreissena polymorpha]
MTATLIRPLQEPLLGTIKRRKLAWSGHVTRGMTLCKTVLQGMIEGGHSVQDCSPGHDRGRSLCARLFSRA